MKKIFWIAAAVSCAAAGSDTYIPVHWTRFVIVEGQTEPIPEQWLRDEEARFAHNLKLPDVVAKPTPFDFSKAKLRSLLPWKPNVSEQYFEHLCDFEAGEWLIRTGPAQSGIYNARPMRQYSAAELQARFDLEAPVLQRMRQIPDTADSGTYFVNPPFLTYDFVEEPVRAVDWQGDILHPYIRLSGFQADRPSEGQIGHPMQVTGIDAPTAKFGITWRGVKRPLDRENDISGVEEIVYERATGEVLAVRRQFIYAPPYKGKSESNSWAQGRVCERVSFNSYGGEYITRLAVLVVPPAKPLARFTEPLLKAPLPLRDALPVDAK